METWKSKGDKTIGKTISKRVGLLIEIGRPRGGYFRGGPRGGSQIMISVEFHVFYMMLVDV